MKRLKGNFGFTFVEIIISIVILGIVGLMAFSFIGDATEIYGITTAQARLNDQLWVAMERISRELQYVDPVNITIPVANQIDIADTKKSSCDPTGGAGTCFDDSQNITYWYDNDNTSATYQNLYRTGSGSASGNDSGQQLLAENITNFSVVLSGNIITIDITGSETINNDPVTISLSTTIYPNSDFEEVIQ